MAMLITVIAGFKRHTASHASLAGQDFRSSADHDETVPTPKDLGTVGGVAREGDSRGAVVAHVAKDHRLNGPRMMRPLK